jgi:hypothetical protein
VVFVFAAILMLAEGWKTLVETGSGDNVIAARANTGGLCGDRHGIVLRLGLEIVIGRVNAFAGEMIVLITFLATNTTSNVVIRGIGANLLYGPRRS